MDMKIFNFFLRIATVTFLCIAAAKSAFSRVCLEFWTTAWNYTLLAKASVISMLPSEKHKFFIMQHIIG